MQLSLETRLICGVLLITVPTIQYGGVFLLGLLRADDAGYMRNPTRQALFRAGHAHAGVLVILSLVLQPLADAASGPLVWTWVARLGAPVAAILIPVGFFLSVASPTAAKPGRWIGATYAGAVALAASVLSLGILLIRSAIA
jgi:hypothetical protein